MGSKIELWEKWVDSTAMENSKPIITEPTTNSTKKNIDSILSDSVITLPKERYSSIDYIMTFATWEKEKIFSSHVNFSQEAIRKMKEDPFMTYEEKWENLLFYGDEIELKWVHYPPIEYEIQKNELSYVIYDGEKIFDKKNLNEEANSYKVEIEEEHK